VSARRRWPRLLLPGLIALAAGGFAYWLIRDAAVSTPKVVSTSKSRLPSKPRPETTARQTTKSEDRDSFADGTTIEVFASCREEELILRFPSEESYLSFTRILGESSVRLIDRLDRLHALRIGMNEAEKAEILELFEKEQITSYRTLPTLPDPPRAFGGASNQIATPFGSQLLPWLGVKGDNSRWGSGVKIAVLDTGILPHIALPQLSKSIAIMPLPEDLAMVQSHATAVASLIAGRHPMARGVAPAVDLISIRILDDRGTSDSFAIAAGLLAAMDARVDIVNLSLGEQQDNPLISEAIRMVLDQGIVVVASSGNEGLQEAKFPAAYPGVIGVGAVDASGERMAFSNLGSELGLTAPGYGVNAASSSGGFISISGTSASAPLVAGAIAATMSDGSGQRVTAAEAVKIVMAYADDEGPPGFDREYGVGVLNLGRIMNRDQPGISDAVVTWQQYVAGDHKGSPGQIQVTVQNRGTAALINSMVETLTPAGSERVIATTIAPGASETFSLPFDRQRFAGNSAVEVMSTIALGNSAVDASPANNRRTDTLQLR
jgi:subtilisin family serine protease